MDEMIISSKITEDLKKKLTFVDFQSFNRIINKITDYAEVFTEGKLAGIINYNYKLNASQSNMIIELLTEIQALSMIYTIAQKGKRDLEVEFISNIISDVDNPSSITSYVSLRNTLENRLAHQMQQYNMNMGKHNTTTAIPVNELHGHVKTYRDMITNGLTVSHKARHGFITASLHDAYLTVLNRYDWWSDKTYMKFFFNEDGPSRRNLNLISREPRLTLYEIDLHVKKILEYYQDIGGLKPRPREQEQEPYRQETEPAKPVESKTQSLHIPDKLLSTPFGVQYGSKIDAILMDIFSTTRINDVIGGGHDKIKREVTSLYQVYRSIPDTLNLNQYSDAISSTVYYLLGQDYGIKRFTEEFIYNDRSYPLSRFFSENKEIVEDFLTRIFTIFFEEKFSSIFRIVRSLDLRQYACAFIIKRIYVIKGEDLATFGFFLIKIISRYSKLKIN